MFGNDILSIILALGIGGLVGAIASTAVVAPRLKSAYDAFASDFKAYIATRSDNESASLAAAFEQFAAVCEAAISAMDRLRRALKRR